MMNEEVLHTILSELSEADKQLAVNNGLLTKAIENLSGTFKEMESKTGNLKVSVPAPDTRPIIIELEKYLKKTEALIAQLPKQVLHEKRITLFPVESHKFDFYKKIFGQFLKWTAIVIIALAGFKYINATYSGYVSNAKYKQAWETLYQNQNRKGKKMLDSVLMEINFQ